MTAPLPRNPFLARCVALQTGKSLISFAVFRPRQLRGFATVCDSSNDGNKSMKTTACDSLHQFWRP